MLLEAVPRESSERPAVLNDRGVVLLERFRYSLERADLDESIRSFKGAIESTLTQLSQDRIVYTDNLTVALQDRYRETQQADHLDEVIKALMDAWRLSAASPDVFDRMGKLSDWLMIKYEREGSFLDLENALRIAWTGRTLTPADSPESHRSLFRLGDRLIEYSRCSRGEDELEEAIDLLREALRLAPPHTRA
jgi:tetratricopeptide (TPR) repeat protein